MLVKEVITADDPDSELCTDGGAVDHDYRPFEYKDPPSRSRVLRCVWCHVVACGSVDEEDPCIEPYHHKVPHRTRAGVYWPIGGNKPSPRTRAR